MTFRNGALCLGLLTALHAAVPNDAHALDSGVFTQYAWDETQKGRGLDMTGYTSTFTDEFNTLEIDNRDGPGPWYGGIRSGYGHARFLAPSSSGPFLQKQPGILTIRAQRASDGSYTSGFMQTVDVLNRGFVQTMGYWEIRAKFPTGGGFWPSFYLHSRVGSDLPHDTGIELDVIEWYGGDPKGLHQSLHYWPARSPQPGEPTKHMATSNYSGYPNNGVDTGFHTYGVEITDKWLIFYFDRKEVIRHPKLKHFDGPLYPIVALSVYDKSIAPASGEMQVDYVKAWAKNAPGHRAFVSLLPNGSFELGEMSYWGRLGTATRMSDSTPEGTSTVGKVGSGSGSIFQAIQSMIKPGQSYRVRALARRGSTSERVMFGSYFMNDAGIVRDFRIPVTSTDYKPITVDFTVPTSGYTKARIDFSKDSGSYNAFVDDMALERQIFPPLTSQSSGTTNPPSSVTVKNPGFEQGLNGWDNWGSSASTTSSPASGSYAVRVGPGAGGVGQQMSSVLAPGRAYRLSMKARVGLANEPAWIGIQFADAAGRSLGKVNRSVTSTSYSAQTIDFTVPIGAASTQIFYWKDAGAGTYLYGDEVSVTPR